MVVKECLLGALLVLIVSPAEAYYYNSGSSGSSGGCTPNILSIYWCVVSKLRWLTDEEKCSWNAMKDAYNELKQANCKNCDKYFHCMGNFRAVYACQNSDVNRKTAEIISNCREGDCDDEDSAEDQIANRFGRNGGDCAAEYLCKNKCKYNPSDGSCKKSNC